MSDFSKIQWCDGTVSPVPFCGGCPLRKSDAVVAREIEKNLIARGLQPRKAKGFSSIYHASKHPSRRQRILEAFTAAEPSRGKAEQLTRTVYKETSSCYAGVLTDNRGGRIKGYAERFDQLTLFPGRMERAAKLSQIGDRPEKPWLNGYRRLWFVNDMGDALSSGVTFEFLRKEIVEVATSENGQRSIWMWLTKRPKRMAEFAEWLNGNGLYWPENLVPMTSVIDRTMALQTRHLQQVPAVVRGLSVEPLFEPVELDLTGIGWVIVGGESGPLSRPFDLAWARDIREQCRRAGVAFFMKQLGANPVENGNQLKLKDGHGGDWNEWPEDLRVREMPEAFRAR